jgi:deoxyribodipyrimidine photo-lyase
MGCHLGPPPPGRDELVIPNVFSSLEVALAVGEHASRHKLTADEFLEESIVRRELAFNFRRHAAGHDTLAALPDWARKTVTEHRRDTRNPLYTRDQCERAATHDDPWNATRITECSAVRKLWSGRPAPAKPWPTLLSLHDRPWPERPIYGTIRSMGRVGMERKTNMDAYIKEIEHLERTGKEFTR